MTPDLNRVIDNHHAVMKMWWRLPEYKKARVAFVQRYPVCIRCGRPSTTPGHSHEDYRDYKTYLAAVVENKCVPLCNACNLKERNNLRPCPQCIQAYQQDPEWKIRYISFDKDVCFAHLPKMEQDRLKNLARVRTLYRTMDRHPCQWHRKTQRCLSPIRFGPVCDRNKKTACGCDYFMERVVAA